MIVKVQEKLFSNHQVDQVSNVFDVEQPHENDNLSIVSLSIISFHRLLSSQDAINDENDDGDDEVGNLEPSCYGIWTEEPVNGWFQSTRELGLTPFLIGIICILSAMITVYWIDNQRRQALSGFEGSVKHVIFPSYIPLIWASAFSDILFGALFLLIDTAGEKYTEWPIAFLIGFGYGFQHMVIEGIAFALLQPGCGISAIQRAIAMSIMWGFATTIIIAFYFRNPYGNTIAAVLMLWYLITLSFYFILWFMPLYSFPRRPSVIFYARFWAIIRISYTISVVCQLSRDEEASEIGDCLYIFTTFIYFGFAKNYINYKTLLLDSKWWQGSLLDAEGNTAYGTTKNTNSELQSTSLSSKFESQVSNTYIGSIINVISNTIAKLSPFYSNQKESIFINNNMQSQGYSALNAPLRGVEVSYEDASFLASTVDDLAYTGNVKLLSSAYVFIDKNNCLGSGSFSKVYSGKYKRTKVAIKLLLGLNLTPPIITRYASEAQLLSHIQHPNVVGMFGVSVLPPSVAIVLEICFHGSLSDVIRGDSQYQQFYSSNTINHYKNSISHGAKPSSTVKLGNGIGNKKVKYPLELSDMDRIYLALGCARGVEALHTYRSGLCHRDIKSMNFLVDENLVVKIADLELGGDNMSDSGVDVDSDGLMGRWQAPEIHRVGLHQRIQKEEQFKSKYEQNKYKKNNTDTYKTPKPKTDDKLPHNTPAILQENQPLLLRLDNHNESKYNQYSIRKGNRGSVSIDLDIQCETCQSPISHPTFDSIYTQSSDVYSLGLVLWELFSTMLPYHNIADRDISTFVIDGGRPIIADQISLPYKKLLHQCWENDPLKRPSSSDITRILYDCYKSALHDHLLPLTTNSCIKTNTSQSTIEGEYLISNDKKIRRGNTINDKSQSKQITTAELKDLFGDIRCVYSFSYQHDTESDNYINNSFGKKVSNYSYRNANNNSSHRRISYSYNHVTHGSVPNIPVSSPFMLPTAKIHYHNHKNSGKEIGKNTNFNFHKNQYNFNNKLNIKFSAFSNSRNNNGENITNSPRISSFDVNNSHVEDTHSPWVRQYQHSSSPYELFKHLVVEENYNSDFNNSGSAGNESDNSNNLKMNSNDTIVLNTLVSTSNFNSDYDDSKFIEKINLSHSWEFKSFLKDRENFSDLEDIDGGIFLVMTPPSEVSVGNISSLRQTAIAAAAAAGVACNDRISIIGNNNDTSQKLGLNSFADANTSHLSSDSIASSILSKSNNSIDYINEISNNSIEIKKDNHSCSHEDGSGDSMSTPSKDEENLRCNTTTLANLDDDKTVISVDKKQSPNNFSNDDRTSNDNDSSIDAVNLELNALLSPDPNHHTCRRHRLKIWESNDKSRHRSSYHYSYHRPKSSKPLWKWKHSPFVVFWTRRLIRLLGHSGADLFGSDLGPMMGTHTDSDLVKSCISYSTFTAEVSHGVTTFYRRDGGPVICSFHFFPVLANTYNVINSVDNLNTIINPTNQKEIKNDVKLKNDNNVFNGNENVIITADIFDHNISADQFDDKQSQSNNLHKIPIPLSSNDLCDNIHTYPVDNSNRRVNFKSGTKPHSSSPVKEKEMVKYLVMQLTPIYQQSK